jgi:zinc transport system ATP-binding protein
MTIKAENLCFHYDDATILENVAFEIHAGEFIGIFGPNGGGKTTLLKLMMGFLKPHLGKITIFNQPPSLAREKMGYVPQIFELDRQFPLTVLDVVMMGCLDKSPLRSFLPNAREKAEMALSDMGLLDYQDRPFGSLSGGQTQRVLLARALVNGPTILLLDEPTASVDANAEEAITEKLELLKGTITLIMVTHNLQLILQKADRLLCVNRHITTYLPSEVCGHFTQGLYHPPQK